MSRYARVAIVIPARDEAASIPELLHRLAAHEPGQVVVADNGSTDGTGDLARELGATVVREDRSGYGAACWAGLSCLEPGIEVVVFLDADLSDDPAELPRLAGPVLAGEADLVIGSRPRRLREAGSMTPPQIFGNWLATTLIRIGWGWRYSDLGPFRAIARDALVRLDMKDRRFGWTVEMQIRAIEEGLRVREVDVPYRRRRGRSKISGTVKGTILAGYWILRTIGEQALRRRRALRAATAGVR